MVAVCFPFISYTFQHQLNSLRTIVSIRVNGIWDVRSAFHRVFFFCAWTWRISNSVRWLNLYGNETRRMLRLRTSYSRGGEMLLIKNQLCKSKQKRFREAILSLSNSTSQRKQWLPCPILCTLQTWVHVTFFYFCNSSRQLRNCSRQQKKFWLAIERELCKIIPADFQRNNTQWVKRWQCCANAGGEYFKGPH